MPTNRVVFSFFRYPPGHALAAFMLMGFQGLLLARHERGGRMRLMGCGSGDGFSIVPDFTRYCVMNTLTGEGGLDPLQHSRLYRQVARPSIEQLHFVLRPASGRGTWDGASIFEYSNQRVGSRPFAVLTRARVARSCARAFWRSVPGIRRHLREAPGCAYHIGFGQHPLLTLATFSVWQDVPCMQSFAYRHSFHHHASQAARSEHWLTESLFVRFEIEEVSGDLDRYPQLLWVAESARDAYLPPRMAASAGG